jgi:hypothetical protein
VQTALAYLWRQAHRLQTMVVILCLEEVLTGLEVLLVQSLSLAAQVALFLAVLCL